MNDAILLLGRLALCVPIVAPIVWFVWVRKASSVWPAVGLLVGLGVSWLAFGVAGMDYEDFDLPIPWWLLVGFRGVLFEMVALSLFAAFRHGRLWWGRRTSQVDAMPGD